MLDDDSFELELFEMQHGRVNFEAESLMNLKCNPLHLKNQKNLTLTHNIDPDSNFPNETLNCDFHTKCSLINTLSDAQINQYYLSVMHLNICSLGRNLDCLQNLISSLNFMFSVMGISETWLQDSTHHVDINRFNFVHNHRSERTGGGLACISPLHLNSKHGLTCVSKTMQLLNLYLSKFLILREKIIL